jgi:hypothetical protein
VKDGGKNHVDKWFSHPTLFFVDRAYVSSPMNSSVALLKAKTLITHLE